MKKYPVAFQRTLLPICIACIAASLALFLTTGLLSQAMAGEIEDYISKASRYIKARDYQRAIREYDAALKLDPKHPKTNLLLGLVYANMNDLDKAIQYTEKALELDPGYSAYNNLALVYANKGDFKKSIDYYQKAIALNPSAYTPWHHLGLIYSSKKEYEKAAEHYKKAAELNGQFAEAYVGLGSALYYSGDKAGALAQVKKLKELKFKMQGEGLEEWINDKEKKSQAATTTPSSTPPSRSAPG